MSTSTEPDKLEPVRGDLPVCGYGIDQSQGIVNIVHLLTEITASEAIVPAFYSENSQQKNLGIPMVASDP